MKNLDVKFIVRSAIIAALYAALTWLFAPISYEAVQFRISEILILIVIFDRRYAFALILGCFIANTTSSLGWYDMVFGTLATAIAIIPMLFVKKIYISAIFPVLSNMFIVPLELALAFGSEMLQPGVFWFNVATVGAGEAAVLYFVGIPLMISISKNAALTELLSFDTSKMNFQNKLFTFGNMLAVSLAFLGIILFIAYPLVEFKDLAKDEFVRLSPLSIVRAGHFYLIAMVVSDLVYGIGYLLLKNVKYKVSLTVLASLALIALAIVAGINYNGSFTFVYFYLFFLYPLILFVPALFDRARMNKNIIEEEINEESEM